MSLELAVEDSYSHARYNEDRGRLLEVWYSVGWVRSV